MGNQKIGEILGKFGPRIKFCERPVCQTNGAIFQPEFIYIEMLRQAISKKRKWFLLHLVPPRDDPLQTAIWPNLGFMALCHHPTWRAKKPYLPQSDLYPIRTRPIKKPFWAPSVPKPFYMFFFEACSNPTWPKLDLLALWRPRLPQKFFLRRVSRNSSKEGFLVLNIPIWCTFCEGRIFRMLVLTYHLKGLPWARPPC